jgi:hypothetical protein
MPCRLSSGGGAITALGGGREPAWSISLPGLDLAALDVLLDLVDLGLHGRGRAADGHVGRLGAHRQAEGLVAGLPAALDRFVDGVLDLVADAGHAVGDVERIGAAAVGVAADDVGALLLGRLLHAAQAEVQDVVVDIGALGDGGQRGLLGLGDVVEIAGVVLEVLDLRVDVGRALAELLAGVDDGGISIPPT